jgi:hypothetical protein
MFIRMFSTSAKTCFGYCIHSSQPESMDAMAIVLSTEASDIVECRSTMEKAVRKVCNLSIQSRATDNAGEKNRVCVSRP